MNYIQSIILGFVEGLTEFFPISSTGHMILIASIMGILEKKITNLFLISVQLGAIFSVFFLYRKKLFYQKYDFYLKIFLAIIPIGIFGFMLNRIIYLFLESPIIVSMSLLLGGGIIIKSENLYKKNYFYKSNSITYFNAFVIGLCQCFSLIPGFSRSATTIIAGLLQNINRKETVEFSFFLSIPVIGMATCKKLHDYFFQLNYIDFRIFFHDMKLLLVGNIISFITGVISIKFFIKYLQKYNFKLFGYYRIILGVFFILIHYFVKPLRKF
ncbi:undecaprenyl-diphosphate phosphatase [Blattabacterium cuenoti]|uniref:undecaprenyl-diphosphate phosphatase n=1 Tax=Blattabacterium cuenoti TaxID=1653831 RepID=UPI00163D1E39|nr:undecaprenyl-diphosphate phosphatase [Blattabacterium cuenoti]